MVFKKGILIPNVFFFMFYLNGLNEKIEISVLLFAYYQFLHVFVLLNSLCVSVCHKVSLWPHTHAAGAFSPAVFPCQTYEWQMAKRSLIKRSAHVHCFLRPSCLGSFLPHFSTSVSVESLEALSFNLSECFRALRNVIFVYSGWSINFFFCVSNSYIKVALAIKKRRCLF